MSVDLQTVVYVACLVVAVAGFAPFLLSHMRGDGRLLGFFRSGCRPILPIDRSELLDQIGLGIRVVIVLTIAALLAGAFLAKGKGDWLVVLFYGGMSAPFLTIPMSVAHTILIRFLGFRGFVVSAATGVVIGALVIHFMKKPDFAPPIILFGGIYGLLVGLRRAMLAQRIASV